MTYTDRLSAGVCVLSKDRTASGRSYEHKESTVQFKLYVFAVLSVAAVYVSPRSASSVLLVQQQPHVKVRIPFVTATNDVFGVCVSLCVVCHFFAHRIPFLVRPRVFSPLSAAGHARGPRVHYYGRP